MKKKLLAIVMAAALAVTLNAGVSAKADDNVAYEEAIGTTDSGASLSSAFNDALAENPDGTVRVNFEFTDDTHTGWDNGGFCFGADNWWPTADWMINQQSTGVQYADYSVADVQAAIDAAPDTTVNINLCNGANIISVQVLAAATTDGASGDASEDTSADTSEADDSSADAATDALPQTGTAPAALYIIFGSALILAGIAVETKKRNA